MEYFNEKPKENDEAVAVNFCYTVSIILGLGLMGMSIFGLQDASAGTATKKAQEIEEAIEEWQQTLRADFTTNLSFMLYRKDAAQEEF